MSGIKFSSLVRQPNKEINYTQNISNNIKAIELNQAKQNFSKPEYLNQFDDLRFDNISHPSGENDSYSTLLGPNKSVQDSLMIRDNYSLFSLSNLAIISACALSLSNLILLSSCSLLIRFANIISSSCLILAAHLLLCFLRPVLFTYFLEQYVHICLNPSDVSEVCIAICFLDLR